MSGRIIRVGHTCEPPRGAAHTDGTVWQCDCGRYFLKRATLGWVQITTIDLAMLNIAEGFARANKAASERRAAERRAAAEKRSES